MAGKQAEGAKHQDCFHCPPESLVVATDRNSPFYDRRVEKPVSEKLICSFMKYGVRVPVEAMRDGESIIVNDGRKRVRGLIEANRRLAEAGQPPKEIRYIIDQSINGNAGIIGLSAALNIHDEDLPMDRAVKARRMLDAGATEEEVAMDFGVESVQSVRNWLVLLDLDDRLQTAVDVGDLSESRARDFAKLPRDKQVETYEKMVAEGTLKGEEAQRAVSAVLKGKAVPKKSTARRMKNRVWLQDVCDRMEAKGALKKDGQAVLAFLRMLLGYRGEDKNQCDDAAEVIDEMAEAKKPVGRPKKQRKTA